MKVILLLALVLIVIWLFRSTRRAGQQRQRPVEKPSPEALDMVRCRQCDIHLPKADAVAGKQGVYCSLEHRQRAES